MDFQFFSGHPVESQDGEYSLYRDVCLFALNSGIGESLTSVS